MEGHFTDIIETFSFSLVYALLILEKTNFLNIDKALCINM